MVGESMMAATGPGRHDVFVKMTSLCTIVTSSLLHLLSSSPASLSTTAQPFTFHKHSFANDRNFSKFRHQHSCTFAGPFPVRFKQQHQESNKKKHSPPNPKRWNTQASLQTILHMPKYYTSKHTHINMKHTCVSQITATQGKGTLLEFSERKAPFPASERVRREGCMEWVRRHLHPIWSMAILIWVQVSLAAPAFD